MHDFDRTTLETGYNELNKSSSTTNSRQEKRAIGRAVIFSALRVESD
jgi:hypothetical protein